jgi:hypothetical protein
MARSPEKIFKSLDFTSLPEKSLISLIKRDDLQMKEIEVWEHVLNGDLHKIVLSFQIQILGQMMILK